MSDDVMDLLDLMGREGPCFHCGIDYTPLWRSGPPEKPVLCNACGSRWKAKGSLEDYVPKHGSQSSKFAIKQNASCSLTTGNVSGMTLVEVPVQTQNITEAKKAPLWDTDNVSRGKRSTLGQYVLSPTEMLHQQLYYAHQGSEFAKKTGDNAEDVLIFERVNRYIPDNEIGLGCMLLKPPSPAKDSQLDSPLDPKSATFRIKSATFRIKASKPVSFQPLASPPKETKPDSPEVFQFQAASTKALKPQASPAKTGSSSSVNLPEVFQFQATSTKALKPQASPAKTGSSSSVNLPEVFQFQATSTKALKPQASPAKTGSSSSVNTPTGEPSQEETIALKFKNSLDITERTNRKNCSTHHMITRSRDSDNKFLKVMQPSPTPSTPSANRRSVGRTHIQRPQGESTSKEANSNSLLFQEDSTIEVLTNAIQDKMCFENPSLMEDTDRKQGTH